MNHLLSVFRVLSLIMMIFGATMAAPLGISWWRGDGAETAYDEALLLTIAIGAFMWWITRRHSRELTVRDGFLLVVLTWTVLPALATLPLLLYIPNLSFTDAYFETVSGLTTTGATVLSNLDSLPYSI
ncbi:MAG: TrkH family potassium uptake protein, partial [Rhodocyclaceae bacterium]|nr:TrkH family potassium uptake protein [Rhodocyclaceae bacterium]